MGKGLLVASAFLAFGCASTPPQRSLPPINVQVIPASPARNSDVERFTKILNEDLARYVHDGPVRSVTVTLYAPADYRWGNAPSNIEARRVGAVPAFNPRVIAYSIADASGRVVESQYVPMLGSVDPVDFETERLTALHVASRFIAQRLATSD